MQSVMGDLQLEKLYVVYPRKKQYLISGKIELISKLQQALAKEQ